MAVSRTTPDRSRRSRFGHVQPFGGDSRPLPPPRKGEGGEIETPLRDHRPWRRLESACAITAGEALRRLASAALAALSLSACAFVEPDRIHYVLASEPAAPPAPVAPPAPPRSDTFVGIALSGGGSRSAVFAAAAMQALNDYGLLGQVTDVSSVSGGGFAAAWYVLNRPDRCGPPQSAACAQAFADFQDAMRANYLIDVVRRQVVRPNRISSPTRRLSSLADALDRELVHGATFADLPASPTLYVNASRLDDARRFVFSAAVLPDEPGGPAVLDDPRRRAASFALAGCPRATPGELKLSLALATSAAFPVAFGPATFEASNDCSGAPVAYWHLADGGVIENLGVDTLEEAALRALTSDHPPKRVLLIAIDGEFLADPADFFADRDLSIWTSNPARIVDVGLERGRGYHDLVWSDLRAQAEAPFELVKVRYTDADLATWPASCDRQARGRETPHAHIANIATSLRISDCDADLMTAAAHQLVHAALDARADALAAEGFVLSPATAH